MQFLDNIITCKYETSTFTAANIETIQNSNDTNGYLAVSNAVDGTVDNVTGAPEPNVTLAADGGVVYGAVVTVNTATQRCGVLRSGIVPFRGAANSGVGDLGSQPIGIKGSGGNGTVAASGATTEGTGLLVGRVGDTSPVLWVDLDKASHVTVS